MILAIRTDKSQAELYLVRSNGDVVDAHLWEAGRQLSSQLLHEITALLEGHHHTLTDLTGLIVWQGPGSFTGLRIGITTANALGYGLSIGVVGTTGDGWIARGASHLDKSNAELALVLPEYGSEAHITAQKK